MSRIEAKKVLLISRDEALADLCRKVLDETCGPGWTLALGRNGHEIASYDLCIWDFSSSEIALPHDLGLADLKMHLFLVPENSFVAFQALPGSSNLNVLLKPVTRASLRAFLSGGASPHRTNPCDGAAARSGALRAERDQILQFLIHANLKLQEYDQERTNFLVRSMHDFRAPLTAVSGYCALVLEEELGPLTTELREVLKKMQQSAARMSRIVTAMFHLSTGQRLDNKPKLEAADLRDCVDQALYELSPFLEDKQILTLVEIASPPEGLLFDKTQLEQALVNLLENACKFTPRAGTIEVKGYPFFWNRRVGRGTPIDPAVDRRMRQVNDPNAFRVDVRDSGPGIPASHVEKIFEGHTSYFSGDDRSGGGLGLAICRMIFERHQGRIWAESTPRGALFSFVLPVSRGPCGEVTATQFNSEGSTGTSEE
jgi:signal transduction histidine kinase